MRFGNLGGDREGVDRTGALRLCAIREKAKVPSHTAATASTMPTNLAGGKLAFGGQIVADINAWTWTKIPGPTWGLVGGRFAGGLGKRSAHGRR